MNGAMNDAISRIGDKSRNIIITINLIGTNYMRSADLKSTMLARTYAPPSPPIVT